MFARTVSLEILDFKTGAIPSPGEMQDFMAPQLLLEAEMAKLGGIREVARSDGLGADLHQDRLGRQGLPSRTIPERETMISRR